MGNWALDTYNTIGEAETAIEALDSTATDVLPFGFLQGSIQKIVVIKST